MAIGAAASWSICAYRVYIARCGRSQGKCAGSPAGSGPCPGTPRPPRQLSGAAQGGPSAGADAAAMTSQGSTRLHAGVAAGATIDPRRRARVSAPAVRRVRVLPELAALLALAAVLDLWALDRNGWANTYYTAAVRSMASSWHNFLYGSFDASGVMTVDKPPLALWVQAASVKVFGFSSPAILVPQALMGVASVALVYDLTRRRFGRLGGGVAGLVLALTPMTVAISRHNNPDALLVLCCVAALWLF